jgi:hypothetical protein
VRFLLRGALLLLQRPQQEDEVACSPHASGGDDEYSTDDYEEIHGAAAADDHDNAAGFNQTDPLSHSEEHGLSFGGVSYSTSSTEGGQPLYVSRKETRLSTPSMREWAETASELLRRHSPDLFESFAVLLESSVNTGEPSSKMCARRS